MNIFEELYSNSLFSDDEICSITHYGTPRHSGRYPWGSGENPYQHSGDFLARVEKLQKEGYSEKEIADKVNCSLKELRTYKAIAKAERRADDVGRVQNMNKKGLSKSEISKITGLPYSTVELYLKESADAKRTSAQDTADYLKQQIKEKGIIDVGLGVELDLNVSRNNIDEAIIILKAEGYPVYPRRINNPTNPDVSTTYLLACPEGTEYEEVYKPGAIHSIKDYTSHDGGKTFKTFQYPESLDSSRMKIRYADEGGKERDGLIEIRPGVEDLSLGNSHYAQVRILVDGTHYIKGMAVYNPDLPEGCDILVNSNKGRDVPIMGPKNNTHLKPIKNDPTNPFGSLILPKGQSYYIGEDGKEHLSLINKRQDEGDWYNWDDSSLPAQFLGKQRKQTIDAQLDLAIADKKVEYEEIMSLTNPTVKKKCLETFANDCDSAATHLDAAALPRQKYNVILPLVSVKDDEVFAPGFKDGETVALVRFPHASTTEIPILTVNNKNKEGRKLITTDAIDAVGINKKNADRLSGADFDGDTVLVIPTGRVSKTGRGKVTDIINKEQYPGLKDFDTKTAYPEIPGMKLLGKEDQQKKMGEVSNLIMDMTLKGAPPEDMEKVIKHSMVIIDAEKHRLNYKQSEIDNNIKALEKEYKGHYDENGKFTTGASTLLTRANAEVNVPKRRGQARINPDGSLFYLTAPDSELYYTDSKGNKVMRTQKSTQMMETDDPYSLSSGTPVENSYAHFSSVMKSMANNSRKEMLATPSLKYSPEAAQEYSKEVQSLKTRLLNAEKNKTRERMAVAYASDRTKERLSIYKEENPGASKSDISKERKKISQQEIEAGRAKYNSKRSMLKLSDREWEAIQKGAIHESTLKRIMNNMDKGDLYSRALPKTQVQLTPMKINKMESMRSNGYTTAQISEALGVSTSTVQRYLRGES